MTGMISSIMLVTNSSVSEVKGIVNGIGIALLSLGGGGGYALAGCGLRLEPKQRYIIYCHLTCCSSDVIFFCSKRKKKIHDAQGRDGHWIIISLL